MGTRYAKWNPSFATGDSAVDAQHMGLFTLVNEMHGRVAEGQGPEVVISSADAIVAFANSHLGFEEALLERVSYPGLGARLEAHRAFTEAVDGLQKDLREGQPASSTEMLEYMRAWLIRHIETRRPRDRRVPSRRRKVG